MGRKRKKILLENVHISDAGAKGKAITRLENGLVLFVEGAVPGDVCDVLVHKKDVLFWKVNLLNFILFLKEDEKLNANILVYVVVVNGNLWVMSINSNSNKKRWWIP